MNHKKFFDEVRNSGLFGNSLKKAQVQGIECILSACQGLPTSWTAYMLGTVYLETAASMEPVKETVYPYHKNRNPSDAEVIARLDRAWSRGQLGQVSKPYWRTGFFGRGFPQLTHEANYRKASPLVGIDLVNNPDAALDPKVSAKILVSGSASGMFTGKSLADYLPGDYVGARRVINGTDRASTVAGFAETFEKALSVAGWGADVKPPARKTPNPIAALIEAIAAFFRSFRK